MTLALTGFNGGSALRASKLSIQINRQKEVAAYVFLYYLLIYLYIYHGLAANDTKYYYKKHLHHHKQIDIVVDIIIVPSSRLPR